MKLVEEFSFNIKPAAPIPIGNGPFGARTVIGILGGEVSGQRIRGKLLGGADCGILGSDGFLRIDVRAQIETHDGARLYIKYKGLLEISDKLQDALANGKPTEFEDQYCYIHPQIETGDERYQWVNSTFFVGQGRARSDGGPQFKVWRPA